MTEDRELGECVHGGVHACKHGVGSSPWPYSSSVFSVGDSRVAERKLPYSLGNRIGALSSSALHVGFQMLPWKRQKS